MTTTPHLSRTAYALALIAKLGDIPPHTAAAARLGLIAEQARAEGLTAEQIDAYPDASPIAQAGIHAPLTGLARAAIRLAAEHPELDNLHPRTRNRVARDYLPEGAAQ